MQIIDFFKLSSGAYRRMRFLGGVLTSFSILYLTSHFLACSWIRINNFISKSTTEDYIISYYFLFATATTLGYGDSTVDHKKTTNVFGRYLFATLIMVFALIFYAFVQSKIRSIISDFDALESIFDSHVNEFEEWMIIRNMTPGVVITAKFEKSLTHFFNYMLRNDLYSVLNMNGFIDRISYNERMEIISCATEHIISRFDFFKPLGSTNSTKIISEFRTIR